MPGKVNPVMCEMLLHGLRAGHRQRRRRSPGAARPGNFELNVMMPVMAYNLLQSVTILANGCRLFASRCVDGIERQRGALPRRSSSRAWRW